MGSLVRPGNHQQQPQLDSLALAQSKTRPPKGKRTVLTKYARHACAQCKKAKTRCEGGKPVCERCLKMGHECVWTLEDARRPLTRAHEQALKHQNAVLRAEVERLTREIESLRLRASATAACASTGLPSETPPASLSHTDLPLSMPARTAVLISAPGLRTHSNPDAAGDPGPLTPEVSQVWELLPAEDTPSELGYNSGIDYPNTVSAGEEDEDDPCGPETELDGDVESDASDGDSESSNVDDDVGRVLVTPAKTLFSDQDDLHHYGLTSVFRLRQHDSRRSVRDIRARSRPLKEDRGLERATTSGYDSASSSHSSPSGNKGPSHSHKAFRSFLAPPVTSGRFGDVDAVPTKQSSPQVQYTSASLVGSVPTSHDRDSSTENRLKRDRTGKQRRISSGQSHYGPQMSSNPEIESRTSPTLTQRHILLVDDINVTVGIVGEPGEGSSLNEWKGCDCQSDCWSRWLPKDVSLSRKEHDFILDRMFLFFTSWCMRVVPEYFLRDMYTFLHSPPPLTLPDTVHGSHIGQPPIPRLAHYSPFLHNMLLAVGCSFSSDSSIRQLSTRARFADEGKSFLESECSRPSISTVQALGLLASYYSGQGLQTLGFTYFGMSTRIAQALGLFADCTPLLRAGRLRPQQVFDRTWCFHMAAAQDACWSLYVGRECGIPLSSARANAEKNLRGQAQNNQTKKGLEFSMDDPFCLGIITTAGIGSSLDRLTWRARLRQGEQSGPSSEQDGIDESLKNAFRSTPECKTFTTFQWTCQLMKIGRAIMDLMNSLTSSDSHTEVRLVVSEIDIQLDAWRQDLPAELKLTPAVETTALPHKLMMHAAFWWQRILLHRPFYQRHRRKSPDSMFSVTRCNVAAREILVILRLWRKIYGSVRYCPITLIQTIFAAGTIYILQAMQATSGRRMAAQAQATALDNLDELVDYLREVGESWEAAARIADIFERLADEQRKALLHNTSTRGESQGRGGGRLVRQESKKRRKLEVTRGIEVASQIVLADNSPLLTALPDVQADDARNLASPPASQLLSDSNLTFSDPQQAPLSSLEPSYSTSAVSGSPIFNTHLAEMITPSSGYKCDSNQNQDWSFIATDPTARPEMYQQQQQQLPGATIPTYPSGYLSDESYISDIAPSSASYMSMEDWWAFFFGNEGAGTSASRHDDGTEFMHRSVARENSDDVNFAPLLDSTNADGNMDTDALGILTTTEPSTSACTDLNMDTIMPGLSLFDLTGFGSFASGMIPTGLGGVYGRGFGFSIGTASDASMTAPDIRPDSTGRTDSYSFSSDVEQEVELGLDMEQTMVLPESSRQPTIRVAATDVRDEDHAFYDMLASLE